MTDSATSPSIPSGSGTSTPVQFDVVALDTADPAGLARFYGDLLGWQVESAEDDWVTITGGGEARLAFQLAPDHVPPTWPEPGVPQQVHLDLRVADLPSAGAFAESVGARRVHGPGPESTYWVYLDPSGHPFCLCAG